MGFCSLRRASLFAFCEEEVGKAVGRAGARGPLTPWKLPGGLPGLSSCPGLCSTSQRASRLGRRLRGYGVGQGSAAMPEYPCPRGIRGGTVPGGGVSALPDLMTPSAAATHEQYFKVLFCVPIRFHKRRGRFAAQPAAGRTMHTPAPQSLHAEPPLAAAPLGRCPPACPRR